MRDTLSDMTWANDLLAWLASDEGWRVLSGAVIPAVAIITSGIIAAMIGRGSSRRLIALHRQDALAAAVSGFLLAGRKSAKWHDVGDVDRAQLDHLAAESETRIRLLPIAGSALAASWASHQLESMKRDSAGFRFQAQQTLAEYRDRLIAWSDKPRAAKKLFAADLERWQFEALAQANPVESSAQNDKPPLEWVASGDTDKRVTLTPEPPTAVAAATGSMPLVVMTSVPASTAQENVSPVTST